ncbi:hypothetical protein ABW19_dt0201699 [Dactylella cylindrospora]|nr:hypothetical protein ABW19_dt0201699 [Dactylella cylindrospora]
MFLVIEELRLSQQSLSYRSNQNRIPIKLLFLVSEPENSPGRIIFENIIAQTLQSCSELNIFTIDQYEIVDCRLASLWRAFVGRSEYMRQCFDSDYATQEHNIAVHLSAGDAFFETSSHEITQLRPMPNFQALTVGHRSSGGLERARSRLIERLRALFHISDNQISRTEFIAITRDFDFLGLISSYLGEIEKKPVPGGSGWAIPRESVPRLRLGRYSTATIPSEDLYSILEPEIAESEYLIWTELQDCLAEISNEPKYNQVKIIAFGSGVLLTHDYIWDEIKRRVQLRLQRDGYYCRNGKDWVKPRGDSNPRIRLKRLLYRFAMPTAPSGAIYRELWNNLYSTSVISRQNFGVNLSWDSKDSSLSNKTMKFAPAAEDISKAAERDILWLFQINDLVKAQVVDASMNVHLGHLNRFPHKIRLKFVASHKPNPGVRLAGSDISKVAGSWIYLHTENMEGLTKTDGNFQLKLDIKIRFSRSNDIADIECSIGGVRKLSHQVEFRKISPQDFEKLNGNPIEQGSRFGGLASRRKDPEHGLMSPSLLGVDSAKSKPDVYYKTITTEIGAERKGSTTPGSSRTSETMSRENTNTMPHANIVTAMRGMDIKDTRRGSNLGL